MNTTLTIKTDKKLRDTAKKTARELGVPLGTVMNALLKQFVRDREITLSVRLPNAETRRAMRETQERKNVETFESFDQWKKGVQLP
ncbi:MAG TPA: type II toxin-antitoxin system RelB/DinJ family antitoxin [Candidatus Paceibacterota bacterium]|nr:type II toxin-antitoxin system RelB/DinJ family antitoxin [Candidatus Paceibacterota bacterium]